MARGRAGAESTHARPWVRPLALAFGIGGLAACRGAAAIAPPTEQRSDALTATGVELASIPSGFVETTFGGEGLATIEPNRILLEPGVPLAGVTWTGPLPEAPYTLELEFTKRYGNDFPCALTFPVAGGHLSLVLGGWGGTVCGLSSLDGLDASENLTRFVRAFPPGARTHVRVEVDATLVRAAVDGVEVVRVDLAGRRVDVREELRSSCPLGIAAFATAVEVHAVRWSSATAAVGPAGGAPRSPGG